MHLDTHFQLPKFVGQMNGEMVNSLMDSLSTYFKTSPEMEEAIADSQPSTFNLKESHKLGGTQLESSELIIEIGTPRTQPSLDKWKY
jgi:hypothetical protein